MTNETQQKPIPFITVMERLRHNIHPLAKLSDKCVRYRRDYLNHPYETIDATQKLADAYNSWAVFPSCFWSYSIWHMRDDAYAAIALEHSRYYPTVERYLKIRDDSYIEFIKSCHEFRYVLNNDKEAEND